MGGPVWWVGEWVSVVGWWAGIWCVWFVGGHSGIENFQLRLKGLSLQKKVGIIKEGV